MEARRGSERAVAEAKGGPAAVSPASTKDIWALLSAMDAPHKPLAGDSAADMATLASEERDTFSLLVGSRGAGKSSLVATFRNSTKSEEIKPSTALEYMFVRLKAATPGARAPVAHLWELAMNKCVPEMMRVPLAPERVLQGAVVIVLDLAAPGDAVPFLVKWLLTLHRVVHEQLKLKERGSDKLAVERLRQDALARYGAAHPDRDEVTPLPVPVLVIGNKLDAFRDEDSVKRKGVTQALRFLAHQYGATLLFTSTKDKACVTQLRSVMKAFAFRATGGWKGVAKEVDPARALFVPAGADLFEDIGFPKHARKQEFSKEQHEDKARQWKKIASEYYPPSGEVSDAWTGDAGSGGSASAEIDASDPTEDSADKFPEPNIDRVRQRKSEELRRYRETRKKQLEKKTKAA